MVISSKPKSDVIQILDETFEEEMVAYKPPES
jgi:hypothetical protein